MEGEQIDTTGRLIVKRVRHRNPGPKSSAITELLITKKVEQYRCDMTFRLEILDSAVSASTLMIGRQCTFRPNGDEGVVGIEGVMGPGAQL